MKVCATVCEFNPFHNGHKYLISESKKLGFSHTVAVMSGNFTQRGEPAIISKWARAKTAILNGANLVIELPVPFSIAPAEKFAFGSIFLANAFGCVDTLIFGSECSDIEKLKQASAAVISTEIKHNLKENLKQGITFAKAREKAICSVYGKELSDIFSYPNNILAIEYIKALNSLKSNISPVAILRKGPLHNSKTTTENFASASLIREMILNKQYDYSNFIPKSAYEVLIEEIKNKNAPSNIEKIELAILATLRTLSKEQLANLPDISEGLDNKIYKEIKNAKSLDALCNNIKSKRYTSARIRRIILAAFLGINKTDTIEPPAYIKVLGFDSAGAELLRKMKKTASLPIITKYSDILKSSDQHVKNLFELENKTTDLYALIQPKANKCDLEKTTGIITVR
ncbi:MAG: tRNA(Met) cytidine acetate ligase [Eubacteriales bacterium SKADARSKE-1]|nr:tRNA(Met) cytidine acetate ligase [Eubacteriales bacterium SKADARSKE-1]